MGQEPDKSMETLSLQIIDAHHEQHLNTIRTLFRAYEASIDTDLCFQSFEEEVAALPGDYEPPSGCLLLALVPDEDTNQAAGCVALRPFQEGVCEMKRLYVPADFRGQGIGIRLIQEVIVRAQQMGYQYLWLDTLPSMTQAIMLYESLGFTDIAAYRHNPIAGVRYLELDLESVSIQ